MRIHDPASTQIESQDSRQRGLTLLEILVATSVLGVVLASVGSAIITTVNFVEFTAGTGLATDLARSTMDKIEEDLLYAQVLEVGSDANGNPTLTYLVPVDVGEDTNGNGVLDASEDINGNGVLDLTDGDISDPDGEIQWGANEKDRSYLDTPASPHRVTLRFAAVGRVNETEVGTDLNRDGDTTDVFRLGSIVKETSSGFTSEFGGRRIVVSIADDGDLDGNGDPDPLFELRQDDPDGPTACIVHLATLAQTSSAPPAVLQFQRLFTSRLTQD
jgi:prepilin-type N-terminal cleavage/methylation domain-containing protein